MKMNIIENPHGKVKGRYVRHFSVQIEGEKPTEFSWRFGHAGIRLKLGHANQKSLHFPYRYHKYAPAELIDGKKHDLADWMTVMDHDRLISINNLYCDAYWLASSRRPQTRNDVWRVEFGFISQAKPSLTEFCQIMKTTIYETKQHLTAHDEYAAFLKAEQTISLEELYKKV